jgi:3-oxoacyl-[acyl-carrier-protein] synthase II
MIPRIFVTAVGHVSAPMDGSGIQPDPRLGGLLTARADFGAEAASVAPDEPRLYALARVAAERALAKAPGLDRIPDESKAVFMSSSKGAMELFDTQPLDAGPYLQRFVSSSPGRLLRDRLGWQGGGRNTPLACATGAYALGLAFEDLRAGRLMAALAGAVEASLTPLVAAAFSNLGALSTARDRDALRGPFDLERSGFVLGEAGAALLLEREDGMALSKHRPLAELKGWACTCDAFHLTAPQPEGLQAARCMRLALEQAGVDPGVVAYVNAHGSGTLAGDLAEAAALRAVFGTPGPGGPRVSSIKGAVGHTLGASGALEAAVTVEALERGSLPANVACQRPLDALAPWLALNEEPLRARGHGNGNGPGPGPGEHTVALSLSMGFGGHNVALVFARPALA